MSAGDKKGGQQKPFLGDDELSSELDAWDEMFDGLHTGPEGGAAANAEVMPWPAPTPITPPPPRVPDAFSADSTETVTGAAALDDLPAAFEVRADDIDEQMTLDRAIEEEPRERPTPSPRNETWVESPDETDFSDVGAEGAPSALGDMLGGGAPIPRYGQDASATRIDVQAHELTIDEDDDEVYTSASRPDVKPAPFDSSFPEDPVAPPPRPSAPAIVKRTGPAIIRRTPVSIPVPKLPSGVYTADPGDFGAGETTRIADVDEMEAKAAESRRADARSKAPTAPPPMSFTPSAFDDPAEPEEDDYEIEIGASSADEEASAAPETVAPRRTLANVVRRAVTPQPSRPVSVPVVRVEEPQEHDAVPVAPAAEDDFSDVAAAVAADDLMADPPAMRHATARPGSEIIVEVDDDEDVEISAGAVDEQSETGLIEPGDVDRDNDEDAYVQMAPMEDNLDVPLEDGPGASLYAETPLPQQDIELDLPPVPTAGGDRPLADLYPRVKRPTSVPVLGGGEAAQQKKIARLETRPVYGEEAPDVEPVIDLESIGADSQWPEQVQPMPTAQLDDDAAASLLVYEREIPTVDDPTASATLRIEAGRLCERLGDSDRARAHYDAALLADPRATAALRGLRRIARAHGDLVEATRHLDAEIAVAGALERRPLAHYRVDLLMASGEHDLARVAVGELLDSAPSDVRALLAQLELAFLDGRADEFGTALEQLAHAVSDNELRAAVQQARAMLSAHHNDTAGAVTWFAAASESDPGSLGARLGAIREAAASANGQGAANALLELARIIHDTDPVTAAALAMRAQLWTPTGETAIAAAQLGVGMLPDHPLVARVAAETTLVSGDATAASAALATWAATAAPTAERAYAAARAAELDPSRGAELWSQVLALDPGDDYAAAQL
ncbi:MAG: hypothetical protein HOV81_27690, partial [Kofleriaceae bacterium]|nr:hypothetical protein [Kofleriaceae bacterium]